MAINRKNIIIRSEAPKPKAKDKPKPKPEVKHKTIRPGTGKIIHSEKMA
jgi:hypothetical protein